MTAAGTVTGARTIDPDGVLVDAVGSTSAARRSLDARSVWRRRERPGRDRAARQALRARRAGRARGLVGDRRGARPRGTRAIVTWGAGDPVARWGLAERQLP